MRTNEKPKWLLGIGLGLLLCLFAFQPCLRAAEKAGKVLDPPLTASQVVNRMMVMNKRRTNALRSYTSMRTYHLELRGLIHLQADMEVKMTYHYPGIKKFTILSQSGSSYVRNHVFKRMLEAENRTSQQNENVKIAISPRNYNFELVGYKQDAQGDHYILKATPKIKNKYLFKGEIWVGGRNFAIEHIVGQPSKSLSWWITKANFVYQYKKVGEFWFPASNNAISHIRIFGRSVLTIKYKDYDLTDARNFRPFTTARTVLSDREHSMKLIPSTPSN